MFYSEDPGQTDKSTPEEDDIRGICDIYPQQADPGVCAPTDLTPGGCNATPSAARGPRIGSAAVLCLVFMSRRRRKLLGQPARL
jgi:hypothetical protein